MATVINANQTGVTDGSMANMLSRVNCSVPIVIVSRTENFIFNDELLGLDKYILCDASEHGWNFKWEHGTPLFGKNFNDYKEHFWDGYNKFNQFVTDRQPLLYFKRELLKRDETKFYCPIEYPSWYANPDVGSKEEFNKRPIDAFYFWGRSHEERLRLHARMWLAASEKGYSICDNVYYFERFLAEEGGRKIVSLWIPHYGRMDIKEVLGRQALSKTSIAMPGAGLKTFRHCETTINSVMVCKEDDLAYSFPWVHNKNCIKFENFGEEIAAWEEAINNPLLYEIYLAGVETNKKYNINNYTKYLADKINAV